MKDRELRKLDMKIRTKRAELAYVFEKHGLDHPEVLRISQQLDRLIAAWYRMTA